MCYLPVHAAMICFLYSEEGDDIPQTETKIYKRFTCLTLLRTLNRDNTDHVKINSLDSLKKEVKVFKNKICRLAFEMTIDSQQVVLQSKAKFPLSDSSASDTPSLGLVTIDSNAKYFGMDDVYSFLHLTFQEYLAAYHIAGLEHQHQIDITGTHGNKPYLQMMWKFFCGIVRFEDKSLLNQFMTCIGTNILYKAQCAFESQQKIVCDNVLELEKTTDTLIFMDHRLRPTDFLAIGYAISTTQYVVTTMTFSECNLDGEGITLFLEKMSSVHLNNIKHLSYHRKNCNIAQLTNLNMLLKGLSFLEVLNLEKTEFGVEGVKMLTESIELVNLKILKIRIPLRNTDYLINSLKSLTCTNTKLELLQYEDPKSKLNRDSHVDIMNLTAAFSSLCCFNPCHQLLSYFNCSVQTMAKTSNEYFSRCSKIILINCGITDVHIRLLVESMIIFTELDALHLDFNRISSEGATLLSSHFENCTKLEVFSAHCNQISDSGALAIASALVQLNSSKLLDLQCNPITEDGASALISMLLKDRDEKFKLYVTTDNNSLHKSNLYTVQQSVESICITNSEAICNALKCSMSVPEVHIVFTKMPSTYWMLEKITFVCNYLNEDPVCYITHK